MVLLPQLKLFPYTTLFRSKSRDLHFTFFKGSTCRFLDSLRSLGMTGLVIPSEVEGSAFYAVQGLDMQIPRLAFADRKSTRLNSSHPSISYAVFCLKNKNTH